MMPGLALTVANPLIVVTVPAEPDDAGGAPYIMGTSRISRTDSDLDVSIHPGASPGRPEFGRPGTLNLTNSPMNPANHSMKEKVQ